MEELIKKAISLLDNKFNLPKKGFLTGGALANTVNKIKFGGKCVINDIDIFILDDITEKVDYVDMPKSYTTNISKNTKYELIDSYQDTICLLKKHKNSDYITIKSIERDGIFNNMIFDSNKKDYYLLLNTFDINCTQVGYDLETNTAYWTKDFEEYIDTKQLKASLPNTPSHTIVRLLKKRDEMEAYLNKEEEFTFLSITHTKCISNIRKNCFSDKYYEIYLRYKSEIDEYFVLNSSYFSPCNRVTGKISNEVVNIHSLLPKNEQISKILNRTNHIFSIDDYKYFFRNVYNNDNYIKRFWTNTSYYFNNDNYVKKEDIEKLLTISYEIKMFTDCYEPVKILFKNLNIYQQIKYMEDLHLVCNNSKEMDFLRFHKHIVKYDNLEDLKDIVTLLKIKYRKNIHKYYKKTIITDFL